MNRRTFLKAAPAIALMGAPAAAPRRVVVVEGNSLSSLTPTNLWDTPRSWAHTLAAGEFAQRHALRVVNVAVGSTGTREAFDRAPAMVDPLRVLCDWGVVVFIEGGNDIGQVTRDGYTSYIRTRQYCQERRAAGWLVLVGTITNRTELPFDTWWWESMQYNAHLRASWPEFADGLVDIAGTQELGATGAADNPTYFRDRIHYAEAGYALVQRMVEAELSRLLTDHPALALPMVSR